jgi:uncharacterized protein
VPASALTPPLYATYPTPNSTPIPRARKLSFKVNIVIIGATGNSGRALTRAAINNGHEVTAIVRDPDKIDNFTKERVNVRTVDLFDHEKLVAALRGHDVIINAAGYVTDLPGFVPLVAKVITAAEAALGDGGRLWTFGGAALLDVPGTRTTTIDLPGIPQQYEAHRTNLKALQQTRLDWSIACPGPMIHSPDGHPTDGLIVSAEQWAVTGPSWLHRLPKPALSLAFQRIVPRITVYYEDVARVIIENLPRGGAFSRKRVGIALPKGTTRTKRSDIR